jgi:hypothetical protein
VEKLHNEELNDLLTKFCWGNKVEKNEMCGLVACMEIEIRI